MSVLKAERRGGLGVGVGSGAGGQSSWNLEGGGEEPGDVPSCRKLQPVPQKGWTPGGWTLAKMLCLPGLCSDNGHICGDQSEQVSEMSLSYFSSAAL